MACIPALQTRSSHKLAAFPCKLSTFRRTPLTAESRVDVTFAYRAKKHCIVCGRTGTTNFQLAPEQPSEFVRLYVCTAALACMRRAKIGGYR